MTNVLAKQKSLKERKNIWRCLFYNLTLYPFIRFTTVPFNQIMNDEEIIIFLFWKDVNSLYFFPFLLWRTEIEAIWTAVTQSMFRGFYIQMFFLPRKLLLIMHRFLREILQWQVSKEPPDITLTVSLRKMFKVLNIFFLKIRLAWK